MPVSPGASGMQPRDPCRPWRGTLASGHKPRGGLLALPSLESNPQLSFATRMEDWTCLGQHKRQPEFPVVTRENAAAHALGRRLGQRLGLARDQPRRALRRHRQLGHGQLPRRGGLPRAVAREDRVPAPALVPDAAVPPALRHEAAAAGDEFLPEGRRPGARRQGRSLTPHSRNHQSTTMPALSAMDLAMFLLESPERPFNIGPLVLLRPPPDFKVNFADKLTAQMLKRPVGAPFSCRLQLSLMRAPSAVPVADPDPRPHVQRLTLKKASTEE